MKRAAWVSSSRAQALCNAAAAVVALLVLVLGSTSAAAKPVLRLQDAQFVASDSATPPPDAAGWQPRSLPDAWRAASPERAGSGWYRLRFELPQKPVEPYALYIPRVRVAGQVFVNGAFAGRASSWDDADHATRMPHLFVVPPDLLRAGANEVQIRVRALDDYATGLAPVAIGPDVLVRPLYERRLLLQYTGAQFSSVLTALFGLFALLLWLRRRHETMYAYFGLSALCFAIWSSALWVHHPVLPHPGWGIVLFGAGVLKMMFFTLFALRFTGRRWPRAERFLWLWSAVTFTAGVLSDFVELPPLIDLLGNGWNLYPFVFVPVLAVTAWQRRDVAYTLLAATAVVHPVVAAYVNYADTPFDFLSPSAYDFIPLMLVSGWILLDRFVRALNESERTNEELERRVAQKHAELEENYQRVRQLEQQQAVTAERARIMSDMHDGIGGQLISTLSLVEHGKATSDEVAAALRECIDDLRLTIDSLEPSENDLLPVLGNLRYRLDGRLKKQGIALDWQVKDLPRLACLTPQNVLHVLRILQEAFTNVLKHAHADRISVETGVDGQGKHVFIRVRDNGTGFTPGARGKGLGNMERRAKVIGGALDVQASPGGTTLNLLLPVT